MAFVSRLGQLEGCLEQSEEILSLGCRNKEADEGQRVKNETLTSEEKGNQYARNTHVHQDTQTPKAGQVSGHSGSRGPSLPSPLWLDTP